MSHTPGPWRIGKGYGAVVADTPCRDAVPGSDAVEAYGGHLIGESIAPSNQPLIAAAPDLLAALKALVKEAQPPMMSGASGQVEFDDAFALAEKAIAKAEAVV